MSDYISEFTGNEIDDAVGKVGKILSGTATITIPSSISGRAYGGSVLTLPQSYTKPVVIVSSASSAFAVGAQIGGGANAQNVVVSIYKLTGNLAAGETIKINYIVLEAG